VELSDASAIVFKRQIHRLIAIATLMAVFLLAACGEDVPRGGSNLTETTTQVPVAQQATDSPSLPDRTATPITPARTLPPSWTPTFTATASNTPTETLTPTPSPTLSAQEVCESSTVAITLIDGETYDSSDEYDLVATMPLLDSTGTIRFEHLESGESESLSIPGGNAYLGRLPLDLEAGPGRYRWTVSISTSNYNEICASSGEFTLMPRDALVVLFEAYAKLRDAARKAQPTPTQEPED
jgi:hypothetical protein